MSFIPKNRQTLLLMMTASMAFMFSAWQVLLNNFVIERAQFTGSEIGILQSLREVPGFLAFTAVFVLLLLREQTFALLSLLLLGIGVALTGLLPSALGLYCTTVLMSMGFHYYETISKSLTLQWLEKEHTAHFMGKMLSARAFASLSAYGAIYLLMTLAGLDYIWMYLSAGLIGVAMVIFLWWQFPKFPDGELQHKTLFLRRKYWLYYILVFLSGARRQIFVVFAGFMMVEKFGYSVSDISLLFIANYIFNLFLGPYIGRFIAFLGERLALNIEYIGLIIIFLSYAYVSNAHIAAGLYIADHLFFSFAIALSTYFQKIADPKDIAATQSVSFTINHIAAVVIPALLGILWLTSPKLVFSIGAGFALLSLIFCNLIPKQLTIRA